MVIEQWQPDKFSFSVEMSHIDHETDGFLYYIISYVHCTFHTHDPNRAGELKKMYNDIMITFFVYY